MILVTDDIVNDTHTELWDEAISIYGDQFKVPYDQLSRINETLRGLYVLQKWQKEGSSGSPAKFLASYSVYHDILIDIVGEYCGLEVEDVSDAVKTEKRADKYDSFIDWTKDHLFEQFTTEQLVEVAGFSYQTTLKFVSESPIFRKIKKGLWEIRDAKADRDSEKNI